MRNLKRFVLYILFLLIILAGIFSIRSSLFPQKYHVDDENVPYADLTFSVLSDIHGDTYKFNNAINDLHNLRPNMDALILNGDDVDQGLKSKYDLMEKCLRANKKLLPKIVIENIGNHEFYDYSKKYNTQKDINTFINRYYEFSGEKSVYHDTWIKGYHFISLGSEKEKTKNFSPVKADISSKQLEWFKAKLKEKYVKNRPIFVFLHQNINQGRFERSGTDESSEINKILLNYPEVIIFTSHTHFCFNLDNVISGKPYTIINTGAVFYTLLPDCNNKIKRMNDSQGIFVEVHGDNTTIKGRDFMTKSWVFSKDIYKDH